MQIGGEILCAACFPEHDLVKPPSHILVDKVERAIRTAPVQPDRQFDRALRGSSEVRESGGNHGTATGT
jgi:hypothetical protein